jgi:hypothetical protein
MMRTAPFPSLRVMARIFIKAVALLLIANFTFVAIGVDPLVRLITVNTWGLVGHGRPRLYYPSDERNGQLPVEALLAAHTLAYTPKAPDEFRVIVLGDSATLGWLLAEDETLSAQLTARNVRVDGKRVVAYNLGYPVPSVARDVLLLDTAMRYQPDLVIWLITVTGLRNELDPPVTFDLNRDHLKRLTDEFGLQAWFASQMPPESPLYRWTAIHNPDTFGVWINSLFYPLNPPTRDTITTRLGRVPVPAKATFTSDQPTFQMPGDMWSFLSMGVTLASRGGARLLLVNEPILRGSGPNSAVNYNLLYERALYDKYRVTLAGYVKSHAIWFVDLWDAVSADHFTDTVHHMDPSGWRIVVDRIVSEIQKEDEDHETHE